MQGQLAPEKLAEGVKCAGVVVENCGAALTDVLWLSWAEASLEAPPNIANSAEWVTTAIAEDGPVLRLASLAKDLQKQQLVRVVAFPLCCDHDVQRIAVISCRIQRERGLLLEVV